MKPLYLELQAFGPYVEKQSVDFEALAEKGMFLLKGPTGSGKTTIFDAMVFALYGESSGDDGKKGGRNELEQWRCNQAEFHTATYVSFTFSVNGHKYLFKRSLVRKRIKLDPVLEAGEIDESGNVIPFFENPKAADLKNKATELIGLTREQFRQVVLLPQGQFEKFLIADSGVKEEILKKIFGTEQWSIYAEKLYEKANARKTELDGLKTELDAFLSEEGFVSLEELATKIENNKTELEAVEQNHTEFQSEQKQKELNQDRNLSLQFGQLHELEKKQRELVNQQEEIDKKGELYKKVERAEKVRVFISEYDQAKKEEKNRFDTWEKLKEKLPDAENQVKDCKEKKDLHEQLSPVDKNQITIGSYQAKIEVYQNIDSLKKAADEKEGAFSETQTLFKECEGKLKKAENKAKDDYEAFNKANDDASTYRTRYFAGIYGELAEALVEGEKCPVCGSTHHPEPAKKAEDSVSKEQMEAAEENAKRLHTIWTKSEEERKKLADEYKEKKDKRDSLQTEFLTAKNAYDTSQNNLIEGINSLKELQAAIRKLQKANEDFEKKTKSLAEKLDAANAAHTDLTSMIRSAEEEYNSAVVKREAAEADLKEKLMAENFASVEAVRENLMTAEERTALHEAIVGYQRDVETIRQQLSEKEKELDGKTEPDQSRFEERQQEINQERSEYSKNHSRLDADIKRLTRKLTNLRKKNEKYQAEITEAGTDLKFAKALRGNTGVGIQRYVLAIMFNQVINEANRMLSRVHGGRYYLYRSDDKDGGNKKGLELKVTDNRAPEQEGRSVRMLSGGEKFLVSLSLSIGLSTVAQKSGVRIEALFIDEGFGTLDDHSINDAMDILESVRKSSGLIGIISHVPLLESCIPTHLEVEKREKGSMLVKR